MPLALAMKSLAQVIVDDSAPVTVALNLDGASSVTTCEIASSSCVLFLGARAEVGRTTAFRLTGVMHRAVILTNKAMAAHAEVADFGARARFLAPSGVMYVLPKQCQTFPLLDG